VPFQGFDRLVLGHVQLIAVMREHRYSMRGLNPQPHMSGPILSTSALKSPLGRFELSTLSLRVKRSADWAKAAHRDKSLESPGLIWDLWHPRNRYCPFTVRETSAGLGSVGVINGQYVASVEMHDWTKARAHLQRAMASGATVARTVRSSR
jgi:hypothetical protein